MSLTERDKQHLWHPLTQHKLHPNHLPIASAKGSFLYDESGKGYIDGISSWYTCMYGHCNSKITERIKEQLDRLDQVVFSGFTHEPAVRLGEKVCEILPEGISKVFFSDNGSTSVDVAIKMALQYFFNKNEKRSKIVALNQSFHGDTFGAMSVSGLSVYNGPFEEFLLTVDRIDVPDNDNIGQVLEAFELLLKERQVAAFIYEPLVQGAAAMHMYSAEFLDQLMALSKKYGTLNIADEVMTGFGKTGRHFASDFLSLPPDIICLSKSLTAGIAPMALTCCQEEVYQAFYDENIAKGFFHGHTYSANPMTCTAALAGIELLESPVIQNNIKRIHKSHISFENQVRSHPKVMNTRVLGVIFALDLNLELDRYGKERDRMYRFFMDHGVFLRPLGNTIYTLPPFTISEAELNQIYSVILKYLELLENE